MEITRSIHEGAPAIRVELAPDEARIYFGGSLEDGKTYCSTTVVIVRRPEMALYCVRDGVDVFCDDDYAGAVEALSSMSKVFTQELALLDHTPDRYEIEGYEVLERVPRHYSGQSSATLYLPLEWANKRVKVVRLDP